MQFQELRTVVLAQAFPLGPPENIQSQLNDFFVEALIEIQRWVSCYQFGHADIFPACATYWKCGATMIEAPRGSIYRAYTIARRKDTGELGWCCPIGLNPVGMSEIRQFQARIQTDWRQQYFKPPDSGIALPMGFDIPNTNSDNVGGRALSGLYALDQFSGRLVVVPWLQSYEALVVEWNGMKRKFSDFDTVPDDPDFVRLVRMWVLLQYGMFWGCEDLALRQKNWDDALADAIVTCQTERQLHGEPVSAEERETSFGQYCSTLEFAPESGSAEEDTIDIVLFGSWGTADDTAKSVAASIAERFPVSTKVWLQTLGDNVVAPNDPATTFSPYSDYIDANKFALALGEGDTAPENEFALVPAQPTGPEGHQRWYVRVIGPVSFFVFNGTTGKEPSGTWVGSAQHRAMTAAITRSTSKWKVAVIHPDPATSGEAQAPGAQGFSWVSDLKVHAVISGNSKNYERIRSRGRWHFVVGTGGESLEGFVVPPVPGSEIQIETHGYLVLTATCDTLCWKFFGLEAGGVFNALDQGCIDVIEPPPPEPPGPPLGLYRIYTGRADFPTLTPDGIKNLIRHDIRTLPLLVNTGDAVAPGYYFVAVDTRINLGAWGSAKPAFMVSGLAAPMATPVQPTDPFGEDLYNGYYFEPNTVDGVSMRLFRFYNKTAGTVGLTIQ